MSILSNVFLLQKIWIFSYFSKNSLFVWGIYGMGYGIYCTKFYCNLYWEQNKYGTPFSPWVTLTPFKCINDSSRASVSKMNPTWWFIEGTKQSEPVVYHSHSLTLRFNLSLLDTQSQRRSALFCKSSVWEACDQIYICQTCFLGQ